MKSPSASARCHCTVGVGSPVAFAVNEAVAPAWTFADTGEEVTNGCALCVIAASSR